jgi:hypothetical protein
MVQIPRLQAKEVLDRPDMAVSGHVIPANEPESRRQNCRGFWMPDQVRHDEAGDFNQAVLEPLVL